MSKLWTKGMFSKPWGTMRGGYGFTWRRRYTVFNPGGTINVHMESALGQMAELDIFKFRNVNGVNRTGTLRLRTAQGDNIGSVFTDVFPVNRGIFAPLFDSGAVMAHTNFLSWSTGSFGVYAGQYAELAYSIAVANEVFDITCAYRTSDGSPLVEVIVGNATGAPIP